MKYQNLNKGTTYTVMKGRKVFRGIYLGRYLNKVLNQWHYHFKSLDGFTYHTPAALNTIVRLT